MSDSPRSPGSSLPTGSLLAPDEPAAFEAIAGSDASPFVLTCDHASRRLPRALGNLGLGPQALATHIAWDIGAAGLTRRLASALEATAILQGYSRLVIDCNRPLESPESIATLSERTAIPGNEALTPAAAEARARSVFRPYHEHIEGVLEARRLRGQPTLFIAVHTFTPVFKDVARAWHVGVLYQRDPRLGRALLEWLRLDPSLVVGDNEPYSVSDLTDYGVVRYGERRGLPHVELEIRQDLVEDEAGQARWAERLATLLRRAATLFPG